MKPHNPADYPDRKADAVYTDPEGYRVSVFGTQHRTELSDSHWVYSKGPRFIPNFYEKPPSVMSGTFFSSGAFKFAEHGAEKVEVVEDLACEEGKTVWGDHYVRTADGREGPTVDSVRSTKKLKEYMRLTGHVERAPGGVMPDRRKDIAERSAARKERVKARREAARARRS